MATVPHVKCTHTNFQKYKMFRINNSNQENYTGKWEGYPLQIIPKQIGSRWFILMFKILMRNSYANHISFNKNLNIILIELGGIHYTVTFDINMGHLSWKCQMPRYFKMKWLPLTLSMLSHCEKCWKYQTLRQKTFFHACIADYDTLELTT